MELLLGFFILAHQLFTILLSNTTSGSREVEIFIKISEDQLV